MFLAITPPVRSASTIRCFILFALLVDMECIISHFAKDVKE
jgi:hypothetical protein